jgi:hypothetical protein
MQLSARYLVLTWYTAIAILWVIDNAANASLGRDYQWRLAQIIVMSATVAITLWKPKRRNLLIALLFVVVFPGSVAGSLYLRQTQREARKEARRTATLVEQRQYAKQLARNVRLSNERFTHKTGASQAFFAAGVHNDGFVPLDRIEILLSTRDAVGHSPTDSVRFWVATYPPLRPQSEQDLVKILIVPQAFASEGFSLNVVGAHAAAREDE